jgi:hypothetical protein
MYSDPFIYVSTKYSRCFSLGVIGMRKIFPPNKIILYYYILFDISYINRGISYKIFPPN